MSLFSKKSKVISGTTTEKSSSEKKQVFGALSDKWKKLNSMDQRTAYTWGAIVIAGAVLVLMLGSAASSSAEREDFSDFETRNYDLANMPFSTDEAEQVLLASKYPDMQEPVEEAIYTPEEKAERQLADEAVAMQQVQDMQGPGEQQTQRAATYTGARTSGYSGSGRSRTYTPTKVEKMNSASLKGGGSGTGISSTFGPRGDFSNFKNQNKGNEINNLPQDRGSGDARKALFQTAMASRAAAGQRDGKELNAKKAIMGGKVEGSDAFMSDSGAVDLSNAKGLNLDPEAPITSADLSGLEDKIGNEAKKATQQKPETKLSFWQELFREFAKQAVTAVVDVGKQWLMGRMGVTPSGTDTQSNGYNNGYNSGYIDGYRSGYNSGGNYSNGYYPPSGGGSGSGSESESSEPRTWQI